MTRARRDGVYFLLIGCAVFALLTVALENATLAPFSDFKTLYYPSRCLIQHHDPYMESEVLRVYLAEGGNLPSDTAGTRQIATQNVYPPTTLFLSAPFAMLPWGPAHLLWIMLSAGSLIFASYLIWDLGADYAPVFSAVLAGFILANSGILIVTGNAAGIAISLCVVGVWCFLRQRFVLAGVLCLAISLAAKPHDAGLVWLYFLLAGGAYRRRALQTLLVTIAIGLPGVLWVCQVAPHWMQEMHSNILAYSAQGGINDPRLASMGPEGVIDLQSVVSFFRDDPRIYNAVSFLICAPLLLVWVFVTVRFRPSVKRASLALAAIAALTLLPVYHRQIDAKLLLLTVPACAMLWAERGRIGRFATVLGAAGLLATGDLPWLVFFIIIANLRLQAVSLFGHPTQVLPVPFVLLATGVFYLWVYVSRCSGPFAETGFDAEEKGSR